MKSFLSCVLLSLGSLVAAAQTAPAPAAPTAAQNIYAGGLSYDVGGSPAIAGTALYARNLNTGATLPTYAFTVIDALPESVKPFTVSTNVGAGIAQQVAKVGNVTVWMPTAAGISWTGTNMGFQWNGGAGATIPIKGSYGLMPSIRFLKSSVNGGSGYQLIPGLLFYWGK
ncbi:MAG TPA: hypothetical protein VGG42_09895 [Acidobacteriaceae bacterium]|jgi:hypothetical protein